MIFRRYLLRELFSTWVLWMLALTLVLFSVVAAKTFNQIDVQALELTTWLRLFFINGLRYFPHLLAIAAYLAVFNTSTRYWQDGEIWIWRNAGVTSRRLLHYLSLYLLPISLAMAFLSGWIVPWSYRQGALEELAMARTPFTRFSETGQFLHFPSGLTVRIEGKAAQQAHKGEPNAHSVFVFRETGSGKEMQDASIWAESAKLEPFDEHVVFTLNKGFLKQYRTQDTATKLDMRFDALRYIFTLPDTTLGDNPKWMSWKHLWNTHYTDPVLEHRAQGERFWRFSFPLHVFLIGWIAWSLGRHNTRSGQSAHLLSLILLDQIYLNLMNVVQTTLEEGHWYPWSQAMPWILHGIFLLAAWQLWLRQSQ